MNKYLKCGFFAFPLFSIFAEDKKENDKVTKLRYGAGAGASYLYPVSEQVSLGVTLLGAYTTEGVQLMPALAARFSLEMSYIEGAQLVIGVILGQKASALKGQEKSKDSIEVAKKAEVTSNSNAKAKEAKEDPFAKLNEKASFIKGCYGAALAKVPYALVGVYAEYSKKHDFLDGYTFSVGLMVMAALPVMEGVEGHVFALGAYTLGENKINESDSSGKEALASSADDSSKKELDKAYAYVGKAEKKDDKKDTKNS